MTSSAWRIVKTKYLEEAFDGEGAKLYGGRWNSPGNRIVYAAEHASLAVLEVLVHLESRSPLPSYSLVSVEFDEGLVEEFDLEKLPVNWRSSPPPLQVQSIGDRWLDERRSVALKVPSVILPIESIYLLNPQHPDFERIRISSPIPFSFDKRILG
jgi:RES domain-containing protein